LFLEQWIPHDFSNQSIEANESEEKQLDLSQNRFGDWARAPRAWGYYHPHHDDYQSEGGCRRKIFRCLNIGTRIRCITRAEVEKAYEQAKKSGKPVVVAVTNHDFREMAEDTEWLKAEFDRASTIYGIPWRSATIDDTFLNTSARSATCDWEIESSSAQKRLVVRYSEPIFGPQPFLAIKLVNQIFHHVNFDIIEPFRQFSYVFDENTVVFEKVESIVLGTSDRWGNTLVTRVKG
jgi:hypothetical protein